MTKRELLVCAVGLFGIGVWALFAGFLAFEAKDFHLAQVATCVWGGAWIGMGVCLHGYLNGGKL